MAPCPPENANPALFGTNRTSRLATKISRSPPNNAYPGHLIPQEPGLRQATLEYLV
ncbi:hypothetical protein L13192_01357 [Pyrenophora tritici-repentis]|uniref:Uncharacterized protein n=1 Tax=Pyrenophora tritici-repentis TaxID=45151 RepID=A0A922NSU9_9PLEO|nr:hypothetical protein Ptr86124_001409 [Pyrenophora tritici-repentis]KAI1674610.1 hypothetical protein L13192_01357 [Pyrenophora tritici-repentis]KAI1688267.1 hypothetical protein KJE20_01444 [Pyrenophora tritici-repentis]